MNDKDLLKLIEDAMVDAYGDTLREFGTAKKMARTVLRVLKRHKVITNEEFANRRPTKR